MNETDFIRRTNERALPADYAGDVLVWDIDKTYLQTDFSSWRGLLAIPFEFAIDKQSVPGAVALIRALRRGPAERSAIVPLYFVSGSPPQLRDVIERKMTLDGVDFDGITFKDQWGLFRARRMRDIKAQLAYKLTALLLYRKEIPHGARYLLFGDDVEQDAAIYALFGDICGGLRGGRLFDRLGELGATPHQAEHIAGIADLFPPGPNPIERIFIHLEHDTPPAQFTHPRVVPTRSFLQSALVLTSMNRIRPEAIATVAAELRRRHVPEATIEAQLGDARARLGVPAALLAHARR